MKSILSLLLYCSFLFHVLTSKTSKFEKIALINKAKAQIRKLQSTDDSDSDIEIDASTNSSNETSTNSTEKENIAANDTAIKVDPSTPVSKETKNLDNKKSAVQINRFANYVRKGEDKKINFDTFFYLTKENIKSIFFRIMVNYTDTNSLRILDDNVKAESDPTNCTINKSSLTGQTGSEKLVEFNCEATTITQKENLDNVELDTDIPMIIFYENYENGTSETLSFNKVNFNGNSSIDAKALQSIKTVSQSGILEDAEVELPVQNNYFKLYGTLNPSSLFSVNDKIPLSILTKTDGKKGQKTFNCTVTQTSPQCELQCDTETQPIKSRIQDMHLSEGITDSNKLLTIKMKNWKNNVTAIETPTEYNGLSYKKSDSSGLSTGAIIGIIVAGVAVLLAVSIIAIVLKSRTKPPMEALNNNSVTVQSDTAVRV